jgi:hypothetical protein
MVRDTLDSWPSSIDIPMPLSPMTSTSRDILVEKVLVEVPSTSGTVIEALMWLRLGRLDPAHVIVQDATHGLAAYVHGMLHRLEGDFWNANYWFRRVRDQGLENRIRNVFRELRRSCPWDGDSENHSFDPVKFTEACEGWWSDRSARKNDRGAELQGIARVEWEAVWENALNSVS